MSRAFSTLQAASGSDATRWSEPEIWRWPLLAVFTITATGYLWSARWLFLDDAFIHLRIATNLHDRGFYAFNGDALAYCTSSPLYTALLAALLTLVDGVLLPKIVGIAIYAMLFVVVARMMIIAPTRRARWLWIALLAAIASPLGVRWLSDGMETGLVAVGAILLARAAIVVRSGTAPRSPAMIIGFLLLGALCTLLRIEFSLLIAMIGAASLVRRAHRGLNVLAISLAVGSAIGLAVIYLTFGTLLPDTAVAKAGVAGGLTLFALYGKLLDVAMAHAAASSLGMVVLGAWLYSFVRAIRCGSHRGFSWILNGTMPLLIALICIRQQAVQGYRYFVFIEFFLLAFNTWVVGEEPDRDRVAAGEHRPSAWIAACGIALVAGLWQAVDFHRFSTMIEGRSASFAKFRALDTRDLNDRYGIAWDVGLIGYFSRATILDGNGLVNGRAFARMSKFDRLQWFSLNRSIKFVFANDAQLADLAPFLDVHSWTIRQTFDFQNFSGQPDRHFLLVRPD